MIGQWNNSGLIFALLPKCLQIGANPSPITSGTIPVLRGPNNTSTATIQNSVLYSNGNITFPTGSLSSALSVTNTNITISPTCSYSIETWFVYNGRDLGVVGTNNTDFNFQIFQADESVGDYASIFAFIADATMDYGYAVTDPFIECLVMGNLYHLVIIAENIAGTINIRIYLNGLETPYYDQLPITFTTTSTSTGLWKIFEVNGPANAPANIKAFELYNVNISDRIATNYALGPTYGGLLGYNPDNNYMLLYEPKPTVNSNNSYIPALSNLPNNNLPSGSNGDKTGSINSSNTDVTKINNNIILCGLSDSNSGSSNGDTVDNSEGNNPLSSIYLDTQKMVSLQGNNQTLFYPVRKILPTY